jgi:hypothetical protein
MDASGVGAVPLAWIGTGATVIALAFTLRPVHASAPVFRAVLGAGVVVLAAGFIPVGRRLMRRREKSARRQTLAAECRRLASALGRLAVERERGRPRQLLRGGEGERLARWRAETTARYRSDYRDWALQLFDEAVTCGAASGAARQLVDSPGGDQLPELQDLYRETAERLESS